MSFHDHQAAGSVQERPGQDVAEDAAPTAAVILPERRFRVGDMAAVLNRDQAVDTVPLAGTAAVGDIDPAADTAAAGDIVVEEDTVPAADTVPVAAVPADIAAMDAAVPVHPADFDRDSCVDQGVRGVVNRSWSTSFFI